MKKFTVVKDKNNPYVIINKAIVEDDKLSWRAKGLWLYLMSRPDGWQVYEHDLMNKGTEGRDAIKTALKELETVGYIHRTRKRNKKGQLSSYEYEVYENPVENLLKRLEN